MCITDETTTQINTELDEDKMQILNGSERLKYFARITPATSEIQSSKRSGLMSFIRKLLN